ncbi:Gfo/Idh/MocA family oxidoreductase [Diaminobutyricibacter tongyongensis]|uniref:Gfo/Idh/MocA family oxidoreductase n=1 Tax=Leifsonia tongyongensis TaxID=1268043 RepID=A0A6L9XV84_9MICO|nr:Gfo/Idh/MocA family oxidoreductase [Diaminobutyricibacter tongyongensis]NEN04954.1 Gfo/Idh/MocA family oxidoreductase [Diaminobutyricibacter tongyongensis]
MDRPVRIGIIGGGQRTRAYFTAAASSSTLGITSALVRSDKSAEDLTRRWGVDATTDAEEFFARALDYVIVCVSRDAAPEFIQRAVSAGIPVLSETPPAADLAGLVSLYSSLGTAAVQVAEQYRFQPHHAARLAIARSGLIGKPLHARLSTAHDYHAMSLGRAILDLGFREAEITATSLVDEVVATLGFDGWSDETTPKTTARVTARMRFDGGAVIDYDFSDEQYFSPLRSRHLSVRGVRGEIIDDTVRHLAGPEEPVIETITRSETGVDGDLEGRFLRGLTLGGEFVYRNTLAPGRLSDDEIAIGTVLHKMADYAAGGAPFYGLGDACHDHYLGLLMHEAVRTGKPVLTTPQPWHREGSAFS